MICQALLQLTMSLKKLPLRGKLKKGGIVDVEAAAKIVLHDWNEGKIPNYTLPERDAVEDSDAVIISEDGKEFNVDEFYKAESSYISALAKFFGNHPNEGVVQTNMASVCRTMWRDYQMKDAHADDEDDSKGGDEPRQSEPMTGVESVDGA